MNGTGLDGVPSASSSIGNGVLRRKRNVLSSSASSLSVAAINALPKPFLRAQRSMLATQSLARTGVRSWKSRPSRRRIVQLRAIIADDMPCGHLRASPTGGVLTV